MYDISEIPTNGVHRTANPSVASSSLELNGYVATVPDETPVAQLKVVYYIDFFN